MIAQSTASVVDAQVLAGVIVAIIVIVGGGLIRNALKNAVNDIKTSVVTTLSVVIDEKVTEKTKPILDQFGTNGGSTLRDQNNRLETGQANQAVEIAKIKGMTEDQGKVLGEHIAFHKGQETAVKTRRPATKKVVPQSVK